MRVLVFGGRDYGIAPRKRGTPRDAQIILDAIAAGQRAYLDAFLTHFHRERPISTLIHGAATGADSLAAAWAGAYEYIKILAFPADWTAHLQAAGPIRNAKMLTEGQPEVAIAFPGRRGTSDMWAKARRAGLECIRAW